MSLRFSELTEVWRRETLLESFVPHKAMHWAYQRIIGIGPVAVPLILSELAREIDDWFWALSAIVGVDVAEGTDSMDEAARAWLTWGYREGYLRELPA